MANFTPQQEQVVWEKGKVVKDVDPRVWRKDSCGAWINRNEYGRKTASGWEIDHVYPQAKGKHKKGIHDMDNLRPMHYENNNSKGDDYPSYTCKITSKGNNNIEHHSNKTVNLNLQDLLEKKFNL